MYNAPSVTYPVGRSSSLGWLLVFIWLLGLAAMTYWTLLAHDWTWRQDVGFCSLALCGLAAAYNWRRMPEGEFSWDGQDWHWVSAKGRSAGGRVTVHLDLQRHMLLRLSGSSRAPHWHWVEQSSRPPRWADLRRAVYSRAKSVAPPHDSPETAVL